MITKINPSCAELGPAQPQLVFNYTTLVIHSPIQSISIPHARKKNVIFLWKLIIIESVVEKQAMSYQAKGVCAELYTQQLDSSPDKPNTARTKVVCSN